MDQTVEKSGCAGGSKISAVPAPSAFMVLGVLVVALAAFLITVKICKPDFDFSFWCRTRL